MDPRTKGFLLVGLNALVVGLILYSVARGPIGGPRGEGAGPGTARPPEGEARPDGRTAGPAAAGPAGAAGAASGPRVAGAPASEPGGRDPSMLSPRPPTLVGGSAEAPAPSLSTVPGAPPKAQERNAEGVRLFKERRYPEAARAFEAALAEAPAETTIRSNLAYALAHFALEEARSGEASRAKDALDLLDRALSIRPGTTDFEKARGEILFGLGNLRAARRTFEEIAVREDDPLVEMYLGEIAYREERLSEALRRWKRALQLGAPDPGLPERIAKVEREVDVEGEMEIERGRHFAVKFADGEAGAAGEAEIVLRSLEQIRDRVGREYDAFPERTISVILYSREEFRGVTGAHAWTGGLYDGKIRVPLRGFAGAGSEADRLLAHEYAHALVAEMTRGRAPAWFDEGIAQRVSGEWSENRARAAAARLHEEGLMPFALLESSFATIPDQALAERAYDQAYFAVDYLTRRYMARDMKEIFEELAAGKTMEGALEEACHLTYESLSRRLEDEVAVRPNGR
jgi:hypothetical protein